MILVLDALLIGGVLLLAAGLGILAGVGATLTVLGVAFIFTAYRLVNTPDGRRALRTSREPK